jgi:hypothetical protein
MSADVIKSDFGSDSCHIRVWSGECEHTTFETLGDKYRCDLCVALPALNHVVRPAVLSYVSGDYSRMS